MKFKQMDRRLITILLIVFVQMLGASMAVPILPLFAQRHFAMEPQFIAFLVSSFFIAQFLAGPTIGRMSDKYGRIPVLIVSQIGTAISFVMLGGAQSAAMLFAARILDGITGGNIIAAQAYVIDITPREKRTQALGYIFAAFGLGFIFGPALGGILSSSFGERAPFYMAAVAATIVVILTWFTLDESLTAEQRQANRLSRRAKFSPREVMANTPLMLVLLIAFVGQFGLGMIQATLALYGEAVLFKGYTPEATSLGIGLLYTNVGIAQFATQSFILPRMLRRYNEAWLVIVGNLSRALGLLLFAVIVTPWPAAIAIILFAMGMGLVMPPLQSLATSTVGDEVRGGALGLFQSATSLSVIMSTAVAGFIFNLHPAYPYWIGSLLSFLVTIPAVFLWRQSQAKAEKLPASAD
ncbi:MAG: MFS transporter [Ardenticatenaceae bacterium]|nr:MFS transporter [Ardenticatenaceae bacterium]